MTDNAWQSDAAAALLAISKIVGGATDLTEALRQTCRELSRFTGAETVSVHLLHTDLRMLVPSAAYHVPRDMLPTLMAATLPIDEQGFRDSVFGSGEVAWSDDVQHDTRFEYPLFRAFPHQSGAVVPVVVDDEIAGAFYLVWWKERRSFDDVQRQTLQEIGRQVAMLLRVKRLLRESQEQQKKAETASGGTVFSSSATWPGCCGRGRTERSWTVTMRWPGSSVTSRGAPSSARMREISTSRPRTGRR